MWHPPGLDQRKRACPRFYSLPPRPGRDFGPMPSPQAARNPPGGGAVPGAVYSEWTVLLKSAWHFSVCFVNA